MSEIVKIGKYEVGEGQPVMVIAECGINHNGDINITKKMIDSAVSAGCDAVKFQKRTIDVIYTKEELDKQRESPWGTSNREQKEGLEFNHDDYVIIDTYCKEKGIMWFASCWDKDSVDFIDHFNPPCYKIASASLTDDDLLLYTKSKGKPIILSTGMSTVSEINHALKILGQDNTIVMHCTSTYPSKLEELNLNVIQTYKRYLRCPIGYSGHEVGLLETLVAVVLGATVVERHITLDRAMYGSDQAASVEPQGITRLVKDIKEIPIILGDGTKKVYDSEVVIKKKLRRK